MDPLVIILFILILLLIAVTHQLVVTRDMLTHSRVYHANTREDKNLIIKKLIDENEENVKHYKDRLALTIDIIQSSNLSKSPLVEIFSIVSSEEEVTRSQIAGALSKLDRYINKRRIPLKKTLNKKRD